MIRRLRHNRTLTIFIIGFLCLNAVGVLCLSYCGGSAVAASAHCERMMHRGHADHSGMDAGRNLAPSIAMRTPPCCMMPVGMVGAPLQDLYSNSSFAIVGPPIAVANFVIPFGGPTSDVPHFVYRPPPLDKRNVPSLTCVIRI